MIERKKKNSSKVNLIVSLVFHGGLILAVTFLAAREGILGQKLKEITVTMAPKEKKPEPPKEKPREEKIETQKVAETAKAADVPPPATQAVAPPPSDSGPAVAPAAVNLAGFEFSDGAKQVAVGNDFNALYGRSVESTLRSKWNRPEDLDDGAFVAEVEVSVLADGTIQQMGWKKGSGNQRWDDSVRKALSAVKSISQPPPKGFPDRFTVRFDVESVPVEFTMANRIQ